MVVYPAVSRAMLTSHHLSGILPVAPAILQWTEADFIALLQEGVCQMDLTPVGELAYTFQPSGISAILLLAESHVALHFWPEQQKVAIDIHVCDYQQNNREKAEQLATFLSWKLNGHVSRKYWKSVTVTG